MHIYEVRGRLTCGGFFFQRKFLEVNGAGSMLNPFKELPMIAWSICTEVLEDVRQGRGGHCYFKEVIA